MRTNVVFDIYKMERNATLRRDVLSTLPAIRDVVGSLVRVTGDLEDEVQGAAELARQPAYRLKVCKDGENDAHLARGVYVRITQRYDPVVREMYPLTVDDSLEQQYLVTEVIDGFVRDNSVILILQTREGGV